MLNKTDSCVIQIVRLEGELRAARQLFIEKAQKVVEGVSNPHYIVAYEVYCGKVPHLITSLQESVYFTDKTAIAIYSWDQLEESEVIPQVTIRVEHPINDS